MIEGILTREGLIHKTALIDPTAELGDNVKVGAYSIIGPRVEIGANTVIESHVVVKQDTKIGKDNKIASFASIGEDPQDLKYAGEPTFLEIGDRNLIREFCTLNRGTVSGDGKTIIGNDNLLMAYVHVAHDCVIGNHVIMANNASLAGHIQVDDYASLGGLSAVHQFCRIGSYSFAAGGSMIAKDVLPFTKVSGYYAKPFGLNTIGLQRKGFSNERIKEIKQIYRIIYRQGLTAKEAVAMLKQRAFEDADIFLEILENSQRGIVR